MTTAVPAQCVLYSIVFSKHMFMSGELAFFTSRGGARIDTEEDTFISSPSARCWDVTYSLMFMDFQLLNS